MSAASGIGGIYIWSGRAAAVTGAEGMAAWENPVFTANQTMMFTGIVLQLLADRDVRSLGVHALGHPRSG